MLWELDMRQYWKFNKSSRGFSLIEVAIAVVVIGIITGFALKGRELLQTVKLRAAISQVNTIKIATQMFIDKYGVFPGALANANEVLGKNITNGNGNNSISSKEDAIRFWQQLNASGGITLNLNAGFPTNKLGGIFTISSNISAYPGTWIVMCGSTEDNKTFTGIVTPEEASFIDKECDTGDPTNGDVRVLKASNATADCVSGDKYNLKNKSKDCVILFKLQ